MAYPTPLSEFWLWKISSFRDLRHLDPHLIIMGRLFEGSAQYSKFKTVLGAELDKVDSNFGNIKNDVDVLLDESIRKWRVEHQND